MQDVMHSKGASKYTFAKEDSHNERLKE